MISGTFVLTDTIKAAFSTVFTTRLREDRRRDHRQESRSRGTTATATTCRLRSPSRYSAQVRNLPGVAQADRRGSPTPRISSAAGGKVIATGGAPGLAFSVHSPAATSASTRSRSSPARGPSATTRSRSTRTTAEQGELPGRPDDRRGRETARHTPYKIAGIVKIGGVSSLGGATISVFDFPTAQKVFHKEGSSTRSTSPPRKGTKPAAARERGQADPASDRRSADGGRAGRAGHQRHERLPPRSSTTSCSRSAASLSSSALS